jgi:hypothetical protein
MAAVRTDFKGYEGKFVAIDRDSGEIVMSEDRRNTKAVKELARLVRNTDKLIGCSVRTQAEREADRPRREKRIKELAAEDDQESKSLAAACVRVDLEEAFELPAYCRSTGRVGEINDGE